jgi:hypothetical protein
VGVPRGVGRRRAAWPQPMGGARQRPDLGARGRRAPRALPTENREVGAGTDRWATAQCQAVVPLIGGSGLSAGAVRGRVWAGPRRSRGGPSPVE